MHERSAALRWMMVILAIGALCLSTAVASTAPSPAQQRVTADPSGTQHTKLFPRTVAWWPFTSGPYYGDVAPNAMREKSVLRLEVGSFRIGESLDLPAELTSTMATLGAGGKQYFLAQLRPSAMGEPFAEALASQGAEIVAELPVNGLVLRMDQAAYGLVSSSPLLQFLEPYHPAYRISPSVGKTPVLTAEQAASPVFDLQLQLFPGEPAAPAAAALERMGVNVISAVDGGSSAWLHVRANASLIARMATVESIFRILDDAPVILHSDSALEHQSNTGSLGDFTYWKVGLDGDGQIVHITDSGMSVDASDFADTAAASGWNGSGTCNVLGDHRKVICYQSASAFTGGAGDLSACDSSDVNGGVGTHGQVVSGVALGNATRGAVPAGTSPSPTDDATDPNKTWVRAYGDGAYTDADQNGAFSELQDTAFDGVAKGARLVFYDAESGCPESGGISPGNAFQNVDQPWTNYGANIHSFSFGGDTPPGLDPVYSSTASGWDDAVFQKPINFVATSAGNAGSKDTSGTSAEPGNIGDNATCKNCVPVGASGGIASFVWSFSSEGPSAGSRLRVAPLLMAEGVDYACRSEEGAGNGENQTGAANCLRQDSQGTSFSSPSLAGTAAIIGEYLAEGFYPDGTNANASNANDRVGATSSALTKAIMIAGAMPLPAGSRAIQDGRFNNVWGYGMVQLQNSLPLADDPDTPAGMILHDLPGDIDGDGTDDGVSNLSLPATIGTAAGGVGPAEFQVLADDEDLAVVLVWHDPSSSASVINDLDLEVRYCGADGTCGNGDDTVYTGNAFSEFTDQNPEGANWFDLDSDGTADGYNYSISEDIVTGAGFNYNDYKDKENNTEAVFVPGVNSNIPKTPTGDNYLHALQAGTWSIDVVRVDGTTNNLPFSVAIVGPVAAGSAVRFDANPVACNGDENVLVTEVDDAADPACKAGTGNCDPSVVSGRTTVRVYDTTDTLVDTESGLTFDRPSDALKFTTASPLPLTIHGTPANNDGILNVDHNYRLEVTYQDDDGGPGVDRVSNATVDCQPDLDVGVVRQIGPDFPFLLIGGCDGDNYLDQNETFSLSVNFFNLDLVDLIDATVSLDMCAHRANPTPDNCTPLGYLSVFDSSQKLGLLPAQTQQLSRFNFAVTGTPPGRDMVDLDLCLSGEKTGQQVQDCTTFTVLAQADDEEKLYITDCPTGCANVRYDRNNDEKWEASIARNPFDPLDFIRAGQSEIVDFGNLTVAGDEDNNGTADCQENGNAFTCGNPGFSGPWTFDVDDEGFRTGVNSQSVATGGQFISNWGEDENFNGALDTGEDKNNNFALDQNWGTGGGCGWMANDDGGAGPGGIWHTGHIGNWASGDDTGAACRGQTGETATKCEEYDVEAGTEGNELWFELLRTPEIHPVHFGSHPDGFDWRTQILDWSWAGQWDQGDDSLWTWEFDLDVADNEILLGDTLIAGGLFGNPTGAIQGGQLDIFDGAHLFGPTDDDRDSTAADNNYGNQRFTKIGGNRDSRRGCYFNDLDSILVDDNGTAGDPSDDFTAAEYAEALPTPTDDDCDNNFDLGPDGCPGACGVDDDGNGLIDDLGDICPCTRCATGPRAGASCYSHSACNPAGGLVHRCLLSVSGTGVPTAFGDDSCGNGSTDEGVFAAFSTNTASDGSFNYHSERRMSPELVNGINRGGRGGGTFEFNNLEDFYFPVGDTWAAEVGFAVFEPQQDPATGSYGIGIDNMVIEWAEYHPIDQAQDNCSNASPFPFEGRCAVVALGETANTFDGDGEVAVSVTDPVPDGNLVNCDADPDLEVEITAFSEAERSGETLCLDRAAPGADHFVGKIQTTTRVANAGDGLVYLAFNGLDTPTVNARYIDQNDGVHDANGAGRLGPDGQPGIAGFDDDGDGTLDNPEEHCPLTSSLGPGRTPHQSGQPARYSDDVCGCLDNPIEDGTFASFDVADVSIAQVSVTDDGDGDGFADPGEEVTINVVVRNLADFAIDDVVLRLGTGSDKVDCLTDDEIHVGRLEARGTPGADVDTAVLGDSFSFLAANVSRPAGDTGNDFASTFTVTLQGLGRATLGSNGAGSRRFPSDTDRFDIPIFGTAVVQQFKVVHNLDVTLGGSPSTFTDDFEGYTTDNDLFASWVPHNTGDDPAELDGTRCQYNDPGNPFGNNTDPADFCELGQGYNNSVNEWHLEAITGCTSQGVSGCPMTDDIHGTGNAKSIDPSNPTGPQGNASLSLSWVAFNPETGDDNHTILMNRMRWVEMANSIHLDLGNPELSYWTQMSMIDGRLFSGINHPTGWDAAMTYICVDDNGNNECDTLETGNLSGDEVWEPLRAYLNTEQSWRQPNFINCAYEPTDDGNSEDDFFPNVEDLGPSSTCFPALSDSCIGKTRQESPLASILGFSLLTLTDNCFPETGVIDSELADVYARGADPGIWAHKKYDLTPWQGRDVLIRFHASPGGLAGFEMCGGPGFICGNRDDGWYIDALEVTGTRTAANTVAVDNAGGGTGQICPTVNCTAVTTRAAVIPYPRNDKNSNPKAALACTDATVANCDFDRDGTVDATTTTASSGAGGHAVFIDASKSTSDSCFGGALQYRIEDGGTVVRDWLSDPVALVAPVFTTTYDVLVRCSSTPSCQGSAQVTVDTGLTGGGPTDCFTDALAFATDKTTFSWTADANTACPALFDSSKGDLGALHTSGSWSGQSCVENDGTDTSSIDSATPAAGAGLWYLARHDTYSWNTPATSQQGDRDASVTICP